MGSQSFGFALLGIMACDALGDKSVFGDDRVAKMLVNISGGRELTGRSALRTIRNRDVARERVSSISCNYSEQRSELETLAYRRVRTVRKFNSSDILRNCHIWDRAMGDHKEPHTCHSPY